MPATTMWVYKNGVYILHLYDVPCGAKLNGPGGLTPDYPTNTRFDHARNYASQLCQDCKVINLLRGGSNG